MDGGAQIGSDGVQGLAALERRIALVSWFVAAGEPLGDGERAEASRYLAALGMTDITIAGVVEWRRVKAIADDPSWDRRWWDAEERLRTALRRRSAVGRLEATMNCINVASDLAHRAAADACVRVGIADAGLVKCAAGAATHACYQAALAAAAEAGPDHAFARKLRLFAGGRWPLGVVSGVYHVL